jgi:hypothetical protein
MRRKIIGLVLPAFLLPALFALPACGEEGKISARSYEVRHRPLADAVDLVSEVLSEEGQVSIQPRLNRLVVQDTEPVLDRVADLLESFDLPPRTVEVTVSLLMGSDTRKTEAGRHVPPAAISREVRSVLETLPRFTKWVEYSPLGSRSVNCVEKNEVRTDLADGYRIVFTVDSVDEGKGTVSFRNFTLQKVQLTVEGGEKVDNLYSAGIVVRAGRPIMLGAAKGPDSKQAIFLAIQAVPR